jgi:hypothetical protein
MQENIEICLSFSSFMIMMLKKNNFEKTQIWKDSFPFHSKEQMW